MEKMDWNLIMMSLRTWTASLLVIGASFITLNLLKRVLLQRLDPDHKPVQSQLDQLFRDLVQKTKLFFIVSWSIFAGMSLQTLPGLQEDLARKFIFLVCILQFGIWSSSIISYLLEHSMRSRMASDAEGVTTLGLVSSLAKFGLYGMLGLLALNHFGVDITALVAGLGIGGIAVALAVQNILGDLFASLTIVLDKPFVVGDQILTGDMQGFVEKIGLKTTRVRSITGEQLIFPNGDLLKGRIRNFKRMEERRLTFFVNLKYETSYEKLRKAPQIIREIIAHHPLARVDRCNIKSFGLHAIELEVVFWVKDIELSTAMRVQGLIHLEIYKAFAREGIELAHYAQPMVQPHLNKLEPSYS
jgi:small-conductance mechanosensitive channel